MELKGIIIMKVGHHVDEDITNIIQRKREEERILGKFFWGYGGTICHPLTQIKPFLRTCSLMKIVPKILFSFTPSKFLSNPKIAREFSLDKTIWKGLPKEVLVKGSKYALICKNLKQLKIELNLCNYIIAVGPNKGLRLERYYKYRVDKACALYKKSFSLKKNKIKIQYGADLIYPMVVFLR